MGIGETGRVGCRIKLTGKERQETTSSNLQFQPSLSKSTGNRDSLDSLLTNELG